jgi:GNAT superfamily N-acetyltransferase
MDLFVHPEARGAGHADALIGAVAAIARRHGASAVTWFTATDNYRAHTVYDRMGGKAEELLEYELDL